MKSKQTELQPFEGSHTKALLSLSVKPFQQVYCQRPSEVLALQANAKNLHVIVKDEQVVGLFSIDSQFYLSHTFARANTPAICNFQIHQDFQCQGIGTEVCRKIAGYVKSQLPLVEGIFSLLHVNNVSAYKASTRGGWQDTLQQHKLGATGVQQIMFMPC